MITTNIHDAKTNLSKYVALVENGEIMNICRNNVPVVEVRALRPHQKKPRKLGGRYQGKFEIGPEFFEPLPDDLLALFNGESKEN